MNKYSISILLSKNYAVTDGITQRLITEIVEAVSLCEALGKAVLNQIGPENEKNRGFSISSFTCVQIIQTSPKQEAGNK